MLLRAGRDRDTIPAVLRQETRNPPLELSFPDSPELVSIRLSLGDSKSIGRSTDCDICLNNQSVSREHAVLNYSEQGATIEDRKSKHGTRVNGAPILASVPTRIQEGATIECGPIRIFVDRVYERVRTENLGGGADDRVRTVMVGTRSGTTQLIRVLRELMRMDPGQGGREAAARTVLLQALSATGLERGLLVRGAAPGSDDSRVSVIVRVGPDSGSISRTVLATAKDPSRVAHLSQNASFQHAQSIIGSGTTETVCARVPVRSGEELYLYLDSSKSAAMVGDEMAEFVGVAAAVCGLVFDGIEYRKLSELRSHFERAANVQQRLLPPKEGSASGLTWALESIPAQAPDEANLGVRNPSGDIVGVAQRPDGSTLAWIGDVCGHGMGAALLMSAVQSWMHAAASRIEDPAVTLAGLNEFLHQHTEPADFASLLVAAISVDGAVKLCDAGHGHAFLVEGGRACSVDLPADAGGMVVGAIPDSPYKSIDLALASGSRLVLATDGVHETASSSGEQFGVARVLESLSTSGGCAADVSKLVDAVNKFGSDVRADDLTVLSIVRG